MTAFALLLGGLAIRQDEVPSWRLDPVEKVVSLARSVEAACAPRFRTDPPGPVKVTPDLVAMPAMARPVADGYLVTYGALVGSAFDGRLGVTFPSPPSLPEGARLWTEEECLESAKATADLLKPDGYALGEVRIVRGGTTSIQTTVDVVTPSEPGLFIGTIDLTIERVVGLPIQVEKVGWPIYRPESERGLRSLSDLDEEAVRVHRSLPDFGGVRRGLCRLVYRIPSFGALPNRMTAEHRALASRGEATALYEWRVGAMRGGSLCIRVVWVDARTGAGVAVQDLELPFAGGTPKFEPLSPVESSPWSSGRATGSFRKVATQTFEGVPVVLTNDKREIRTLRFDAKSGLVRDESGTYRPDAALLKAMRAQGPVRAFGKR